jgi:hypothetical protein
LALSVVGSFDTQKTRWQFNDSVIRAGAPVTIAFSAQAGFRRGSALGTYYAYKLRRLFGRGGIEGVADAFSFGEDAQGVFTEDFADLGFGIALF